jgi:hypothetical protein
LESVASRTSVASIINRHHVVRGPSWLGVTEPTLLGRLWALPESAICNPARCNLTDLPHSDMALDALWAPSHQIIE